MVRINAVATNVLLFLLASLLAVTLIMQPRPKPDGDAVALAGNTLGIHAWMAGAEFTNVVREVSHLPQNLIFDELKNNWRYFTRKGRVIVVPAN